MRLSLRSANVSISKRLAQPIAKDPVAVRHLSISKSRGDAGEIPRTHSVYFSFDKGMDTGVDTGMPAYENYKTPKGAFSGTIEWAEITLGDDDQSHLIIAEEHLAAAMKHQ